MIDASKWLPLVQSFGIVTSFLYAANTAHKANRGRRASNYLSLLNNHRTLWAQTFKRPELTQPLSAASNMSLSELTEDQQTFLRMVLLHVSATYEVGRAGEITAIENLRIDLKEMFSIPVMRELWIEARPYHNRRFVHFMDNCLYDNPSRSRPYRERVKAAWAELVCP